MSTPAASESRIRRRPSWTRAQDVHEPLVSADLELLPAVLVDEWGPQDGELFDARRQRNGTDDIRAVRWAVSTICAAD